MLIRWYWRACGFRQKKWGAAPLDAFWVEATAGEAEDQIFPRLKGKGLEETRLLAAKVVDMAEVPGKTWRPCCFLVARDLSQIDPFPANYPFHPMWNAYSPFREMPAIEIGSLEDARGIKLPSREGIEE